MPKITYVDPCKRDAVPVRGVQQKVQKQDEVGVAHEIPFKGTATHVRYMWEEIRANMWTENAFTDTFRREEIPVQGVPEKFQNAGEFEDSHGQPHESNVPLREMQQDVHEIWWLLFPQEDA